MTGLSKKLYLSIQYIVLILVLVACGKKQENLINDGPSINYTDLPDKGKLIYENSFSNPDLLSDWRMEGPGSLDFVDGWMEMHAPDWKWYNWLSNPGHHVFWCPVDFPDSFVAEWEAQNLKTEAGLCIVFFSAKGREGEDLFDPSLPERNGKFTGYTKGAINCYHISYYANAAHNPDRKHANLRKNKGFHLVQTGHEGIPADSTEVHRVQLIKNEARILLLVDDRKVIDWTDASGDLGPVFGEGKLGLRQMRWSHFRYRNFKVWELADSL
jgi:hypothetical protein